MSKKGKKKTRSVQQIAGPYERPMRELQEMKHRDLQRACILRGMPSEEMVKADHWKLVEWFCHNYDNAQNDQLLIQHDIWVEGELKEKGYKDGDVMLSPALRFSVPGNIENMDKIKTIKPQASPEIKTDKKPKATIDESTGVRSGTKKALTFELTLAGKDIEVIVKEVIKKFPEAQEKSIKIWHKKCLKNKT